MSYTDYFDKDITFGQLKAVVDASSDWSRTETTTVTPALHDRSVFGRNGRFEFGIINLDDWRLDDWKLSDVYVQSDMSGYKWTQLIRYQPEHSELCEWDKLCGSDWARLLLSQPQFVELCTAGGYWEKLDGYDWYYLLLDHPEFCNTEQLQLLAVSKTEKAFYLLTDPPDSARRLHELKWVL